MLLKNAEQIDSPIIQHEKVYNLLCTDILKIVKNG